MSCRTFGGVFRRLAFASGVLGIAFSLLACTTAPSAPTGKTGDYTGPEDANPGSAETEPTFEAMLSTPSSSADASSICSCDSCDDDPEERASHICEASFAFVERASGCEGYVIYRYMNADRSFVLFVEDDGALLAHVSRTCQAGTEPPSSCATDVCTVCLGPGAEEAQAGKLAPNCN